MPYLGNSPQQNIRQRYYYTATASQTVFSGADDNGLNLKYQDGKYLDVYLNGTLLQDGTDYTALTKSSITLASGVNAGDLIEIVAYGVFSVADTVSASLGGSFTNNVNFTADVNVTGNLIVDGVNASDLGGGYYSGNRGSIGTNASLGDIFRVHTNTLNANVTIYSGNNALCAGPITVATGKILVIQANARVSIV